MVPRLLLQRWQETLTMVGKSGTKLPRLVEKAIGWRWSDAVGFLASALGKNDRWLKNLNIKKSLSNAQLYKNVGHSLATLCLVNDINLMHLAGHVLYVPACFPSYCETIKKTALDPVFFNCHRCHHCVLLATGESTRLKRRPYLFQSAREIKETNSSKYQTSFRSLKREILWRFCHKLSN